MIALPLLWIIAWIAIFAVAPAPSFIGVIVFAGIAIGFVVVVDVLAIVMTWRRSVMMPVSPPWWTRWYALVGILLLAAIANNLAVGVAHRFYKPFYMPGESMAPALGTYDKIIADMRAGRHPAVGDVVLIRSGATTYVKRVIGLPGQRVSISNDIPSIDGVKATVQSAGWTTFATAHGSIAGRLFHEMLPGTATSHDILITEPTAYGNMDETIIPPGMVFVLGDNRERSVDSRLPVDEQGLGMVPISNIVGQPLYVTWSHDHTKIGRPVSR